jgi:hypothetical protein
VRRLEDRLTLVEAQLAAMVRARPPLRDEL